MIFRRLRSTVNWLLSIPGYRIVKIETPTTPLHSDMDQEFQEIYESSRPYTMTSMANMYALYKGIQYVTKNQIHGDFVECGVWKGGSSMVAALTLLAMGDSTRRLWLYDTYAGMTEPGEQDIRIIDDMPAYSNWKDLQRKDSNLWNISPLEEVRANIYSTGYPKENIMFVQGKVEDTIPQSIPSGIALLRLDTDWYDSTYHELQHLFPILSDAGLVILDDYGWWQGAHQATDKYFSENEVKIYLSRVDTTSRVAVKVGR